MLNRERHAFRARVLPLGLFSSLVFGVLQSGLAQLNLDGLKTNIGHAQSLRLEGELEILNQDFRDHARTLYFLKLHDGTRVPLTFAKDPPKHFLSGDHVRAEGQLSGGSLVLASGNTNLTSAASTGTTASTTGPLPNTFGAQYALVILVNFQDAVSQPYTITDAQNAYFGDANNFIAENSYGQTSLTGTVVGWYTIPDSVTTCNLSQIASDAQAAAVAAGVNLSGYTRYVYAFPYNTACGWAGSSYVGGNPSQSWINGNSPDVHTIDHEFGHAFGLMHSHLLDCGTSATIGSSCTVVEYGDQFDTMGTPQTASPHYNAFQKERLGWLNYGASPSIQTVQSSGIYTIAPYELDGPGPNALKILKLTDPTTGARTWYYLEQRQALGFDAFLSNSSYYTQNETTGVLFHMGTDGDANSSDLLDMTPATPISKGWYDASLAVGQSFQDSAAGVTITPTAVSSTGATVQITMSGQAPAPTTTTSLSINQSSYLPGQSVAVTVTMFSGTSPVVGASATITVTPPNGKAANLSGTTGSNGTALLSYSLSKRAAVGTYQVQAQTKSSAGSGSAKASFNVQ